MKLKLDILEFLDGIGSIGAPTKTVVQQVQLTARPTPTATEVEYALNQMEAAKLVVTVRDELDERVVIWVITSSGKAQARAHGR
jgi:DNA-binding MarR family transcriptional regulator